MNSKPTNFRFAASVLFLALFFAIPVCAQKPEAKPTPTPERTREIVALLNDARLAAPELAVDTFLKVVESKKVTDPVWRREIIDEALRMIDDVQYPMPMQPAFGGQNEINDTAEYILASAYLRKLDRLSFQGRIISLISETDPQRAKQLVFQTGGQFKLKPRACEDIMTYNVGDIYPVVAKVATAAFTERQVAEGQRALFVAPWIENIDSPTQISAVLDLVRKMKGPALERQILFNALSSSINRNFKDDRSFTNSLRWGGIAAVIGKTIAAEPDLLKSELTEAYRSMLTRNLRATRCEDNEIKKDGPLPDYVEEANKLMPDKPLTYDDVAASDLKGTVKIEHLMVKYPGLKKLRDDFIEIKGTTIVDNGSVKHDPTDAEWVARVDVFMDRLLAYTGTDGETESALLMMKSSALGAFVADAVGPGELRKSIVRKYLRLLAGLSLQKSSFIEWYFWIGMMENMDPADFSEVAPEFPNPNLRVMVAAKKLLEEPKKDPPKPAAAPTPKS